MGQKTNPNILRLGKVKEWKSRYIEKKTTESSAIMFKELEIRKFIFQLFAKHALQIHEFKTAYSESSLVLCISFYNSIKTSLTKVKLQNKKTPSNSFLKKVDLIKIVTLKKQTYSTKVFQTIFNNSLKINQNRYLLTKKNHRLNSVKYLKNYTDGKKHNTVNEQNSNLFVAKILKGLTLFTNRKQDVSLHLKQLNTETSLLQKMSKKNKKNFSENFIKLRKFQQNEFFKKGLNVLYQFSENSQNPKFLADFVALYLKKLKRPNFFLRFLKTVLKTITNKNLSKLERIQIKIKGRFNGAPRSRQKLVTIGKNVPVLTLNSKINYGEATAYTSNGTFGVKVLTYTQQ